LDDARLPMWSFLPNPIKFVRCSCNPAMFRIFNDKFAGGANDWPREGGLQSIELRDARLSDSS